MQCAKAISAMRNESACHQKIKVELEDRECEQKREEKPAPVVSGWRVPSFAVIISLSKYDDGLVAVVGNQT